MNQQESELTCCVCYRIRGVNTVTFTVYLDDQDHFQQNDFFVNCDQCVGGLYCISCLHQLNGRCAVCCIPMVIHQQNEQADESDSENSDFEENYEYYYQTVSIELNTVETQFDVEFEFFDQGYSMAVPYSVQMSQNAMDILSNEAELRLQIMGLPLVVNDDQWIENAQTSDFKSVFLQYIGVRIRQMITNLMENHQNQDDFEYQMETDAFTIDFQQRTILPEFQTILNPLHVYIQLRVDTQDCYPILISIQTTPNDTHYVLNNLFAF